jgi:orotidine-5'-phosphate decarboxylase
MTAPKIDHRDQVSAEERLIVALDVETADDARAVVGELDGLVSTFKVGLQLFTAAGPGFVRELAESGKRVFLDLKFHDIPNTVAKAGVEAARCGVWMFNVHAAGGSEMMKRTVAEVAEFCSSSNRRLPLIIGVTVLTSSASQTLRETGVESDVVDQVTRLAILAQVSGLDGVVASANEIGAIRDATTGKNFLIVTPGIRPENATNDDQKRVMTPGSAISSGADHLVVGRPIVTAAERRKAAEHLLDEIKRSL